MKTRYWLALILVLLLAGVLAAKAYRDDQVSEQRRTADAELRTARGEIVAADAKTAELRTLLDDLEVGPLPPNTTPTAVTTVRTNPINTTLQDLLGDAEARIAELEAEESAEPLLVPCPDGVVNLTVVCKPLVDQRTVALLSVPIALEAVVISAELKTDEGNAVLVGRAELWNVTGGQEHFVGVGDFNADATEFLKVRAKRRVWSVAPAIGVSLGSSSALKLGAHFRGRGRIGHTGLLGYHFSTASDCNYDTGSCSTEFPLSVEYLVSFWIDRWRP